MVIEQLATHLYAACFVSVIVRAGRAVAGREKSNTHALYNVDVIVGNCQGGKATTCELYKASSKWTQAS